MGLIAKEKGMATSFKPVPVGMHLARCYRVVDLGTQNTTYMGETKKQHKVMVQFEVHGEDDNGQPLVTSKGEPMTISKNYTMSLNTEARLRKDLASWRSRDFTEAEKDGFSITNILGVWAMITVSESSGDNGKTYTNIVGINPVPAKIKQAGLPEGFNKAQSFDLDKPDMEMFETFSDGLKAKITASPEWKKHEHGVSETASSASRQQGSGFNDMDEDIPF